MRLNLTERVELSNRTNEGERSSSCPMTAPLYPSDTALSGEDADNLQDTLANTKNVFYDIDRRVLMFGVTKTGD